MAGDGCDLDIPHFRMTDFSEALSKQSGPSRLRFVSQ